MKAKTKVNINGVEKEIEVFEVNANDEIEHELLVLFQREAKHRSMVKLLEKINRNSGNDEKESRRAGR